MIMNIDLLLWWRGLSVEIFYSLLYLSLGELVSSLVEYSLACPRGRLLICRCRCKNSVFIFMYAMPISNSNSIYYTSHIISQSVASYNIVASSHHIISISITNYYNTQYIGYTTILPVAHRCTATRGRGA